MNTNKIFPYLLLLVFGCNNNQESKPDISVYSDTIIKQVQTDRNMESNTILSSYQSIQVLPVKLNTEETFTLPLIKEENGKYFVYDDAFEEPVDEVAVSLVKDSLSFTYGDYTVSAIQLEKCKDAEYVSILIGSLAGSFQSYTLMIFKQENTNIWVDVTDTALNFHEINASFKATKSDLDIAPGDFEFAQTARGGLVVRLNAGKLGPAYQENNSEDPIFKTTDVQRNKEVQLQWSSEICKFAVK